MILPTLLSDHNIMLSKITLTNTPKKSSKVAFNSSLLSNDSFCHFFKNVLQRYITINEGSVDDPQFFWGALKGFICNTAISYSAYQNKTRLEKINQLEAKLSDLESIHQASPSDDLKVTLDVTRSELNSLPWQRGESLILRTRINYYFNGPRPSHMLSLKIKQNEKFSNITLISSSNGHGRNKHRISQLLF